MKEILLTSSVLILALLALRRLFRKALSRRAQYALWGLVLLRLLVPVSLPAAEFSLLTAAEPVTERMETLYLHPLSGAYWGQNGAPVYGPPDTPEITLGPATTDGTQTFSRRDAQGTPVTATIQYQYQVPLSEFLPLLRSVWYGGMVVMTCWLVLSNLLFWEKLRRARTPYPVEDFPCRVYLVEEGLPSPCLFGLFRPAVYLTPAALQSPDRLRHVLAHEEAHARHWDPLWSLLRGVCLVVYWFDPLVWWAALASRTDCELACDEGALRRLGEAERIPYGKTLLSLIPVRKAPSNPLLSATTMTAGKRQLKDRITRIAENRACLGRALFAAVALAGLVCAVTFTGAKKPEANSAYATVDEAAAALAEDLRNFGGPEGDITSKLVVYTPEDPPMHFDLDDGEMLRVYWGMYVALSSNLTNPMGRLCSLYRLDLEPDYMPRNMEILGSDGQYQYGLACAGRAPELKAGRTEGMNLMNRVSERIREAVLSCESVRRAQGNHPDWEPIFTIPLNSLEPYEPEVPEPVPFPYESCRMLGGLEDPEHVLGDYGLMFFEAGPLPSTGGEVFAGVQHLARSSFPEPFWSFRPGAGGQYSASLFRNLLGHDGFCITYNANDGPRTLTHEYYYLDGEGRPVLLARLEGYPQRIDLDGDGVDELLSLPFAKPARIYFRRGARHYQADLDQLLSGCWSEGTDFYYELGSGGELYFRASPPPYTSGFILAGQDFRMLYFDGENLLVYNDQRHFENHVLSWPDLPGAVTDAAREEVQTEFEAAGELYDDWRVTQIDGPQTLEIAEESFAVFRVRYEFHTPEPRYSPALDSPDCWADPCFPEYLYLFFRNNSPDQFQTDLTYLFSMRQYLWPSADQLPQRLSWIPLGTATLHAAASTSSEAVSLVLDRLLEAGPVNLTPLSSQGGGRRDADLEAIGGDLIRRFYENYDWTYAEDPGDMPAESLLMISAGGDLSLRFWPDSDLVLARHSGDDTWFRALPKSTGPDDSYYLRIYGLMELWYEEAAKGSPQ